MEDPPKALLMSLKIDQSFADDLIGSSSDSITLSEENYAKDQLLEGSLRTLPEDETNLVSS